MRVVLILALKIQCSSPMNKELISLGRGFFTQKRGEIEVKGKGKQVTYWLLGKDENYAPKSMRRTTRCVGYFCINRYCSLAWFLCLLELPYLGLPLIRLV